VSRDLTIAEAQIEVERARARLLDTAAEIQDRLNPRTLARDAWEGAKIKGADLAEEAVDAVKARPLAATGIAAALALFLAREPLIGMAGKVMDDMGEKRAAKKQRKAAAKRPKAPSKTVIAETKT
jgi:ElaB/YqjD/DUF883 family membrane-anchored ribosome-binding protein